MTDTVTDFHNRLLPRGVALFASGAVVSGTVYSAEDLISIAPSGQNVSYIIDTISFVVEYQSSYGNGILVASSGGSYPMVPINTQYVNYWDDWQDIILSSNKDTMNRWTDTGYDDIAGVVELRPMLQLDAGAVDTFKMTINGTANGNGRFIVKYYKMITQDV